MIFQANKPNKKTYILQSIIAAAIITVVLTVDLLTKTAAVNSAIEAGMSPTGGYFRVATVIENFFYITYVQNDGAAWSIGGGNNVFMTIVIIMTFVVTAALLVIIFFPDKRKTLLAEISLALITGGAVGNLVDRLYLGYVRDFLDFYIFGYNFPVFNVADMSLVVGVGLMIVVIIRYFIISERAEKAAKAAQVANNSSNADDTQDNSTDEKK